MAQGLNSVTLTGSVMREPDLRKYPDTGWTLRFALAVNHWVSLGDGSGRRETTAVEVRVYGGRARRLAGTIHKRDLVGVQGQVSSRDVGEGGASRWAFFVVADGVALLARRGEAEHAGSPHALVTPGEVDWGEGS